MNEKLEIELDNLENFARQGPLDYDSARIILDVEKIRVLDRIATRLEQVPDDGTERKTWNEKKDSPRENSAAQDVISGTVEAFERKPKVVWIDVVLDGSNKLVRCVVFHNKDDYMFDAGDKVTFSGEWQDNTFNGRTTKQFVVKDNLSPKSSAPKGKPVPELTDDDVPF